VWRGLGRREDEDRLVRVGDDHLLALGGGAHRRRRRHAREDALALGHSDDHAAHGIGLDGQPFEGYPIAQGHDVGVFCFFLEPAP